jgi:predicted lysophospholipase L1 biosynthesis ABC-type transport system permease subunit
MKAREDTRMGLRWVLGRPVETLLLVVGISLGIGAAAAGIALAGQTARAAQETLASTQYREIVVTARQSATDMDLPAVARSASQNVVLTTADLSARAEAPDVQYAYIANRMDMRLGVGPGGGPDGGLPPDAPGSTTAAAGATGAATAATTTTSTAAAVTLDGPQPVLGEIQGYEVSQGFFSAWNMTASAGSLFASTDMKNASPVLVLGSRLATTLFEDGTSLGRQVLSRGKLYTVTGILARTGTDYDGMAFTPALMVELQGAAAQAQLFMRFDTSLHFTVADASRLEQARTQLASWFTAKDGNGSVVITVPRSTAEAARDRGERLVTVILFLALSALLIAAANVTNILGSRAMRKRRSVGVLKALGASAGSVFRLFLLEALIIGAAGAVLGTGFSVLISWLMEATMGFGGVLAGLLAAGLLAAAALVTAFDILPALQAARVPAAEAIRHE